LHGWALNHHVWHSVAEHYGVKYRVMAMDLPGHGRSHDVALQKYDLDSLSDCVAAALSESAIVVGWSLGAMVAMNMAMRYPDKVEKLITVAGSAQFVADANWPYGTEMESFLQFATGLRDNYRPTIERFLAIQSIGSKDALTQIRRLKQIMFSEPDPSMQALVGGLEILRAVSMQKRLGDIACPSLFIAGSADRLIRSQASQASAALIKQASYREIQNAGHAPFISHPMSFYTALEDML